MAHSYSSQRDKNLSSLAGLAANNRGYSERNRESKALLANQVLLQVSFHFSL